MNSMIERLNGLRTALGLKPLKGWKESKAKLEAAISKAEGELKVDTAGKIDRAPLPVKPPADAPVGAKVEVLRTAAAKKDDKAPKAEDKKARKAPAEAPAKDTKQVTLAEIAAELKIDDKVARAKMRRLRDSGSTLLPARTSDSGWTFAAKDAAAVKALLQADNRGKNVPPAKKATTKVAAPKATKKTAPKIDDKTEYKAVPTGEGTKHVVDRDGKRLVGTYANLGRANIAIVQMRRGERDWEVLK